MLTLHFTDLKDFRHKKVQSIIHDEILSYIFEKMENEGSAEAMKGFKEIEIFPQFDEIQSEMSIIINECREIINIQIENENKGNTLFRKNQRLIVKDEYTLLVDAYQTAIYIDDNLATVYAAEAIKEDEIPDADGWQDVYVLYWYPSDLQRNHPLKVIKCGIKYNTDSGKYL